MWFIFALAAAAPPDAESTRDEMAEHWSAGVAVRDAVVERDLDKARLAASTWLARAGDSSDEMVDTSRTWLRPRFAALAAAPDLKAAAMEVGRLGAACGSCHVQQGQQRSFLPPEPPGSRAAMDYHKAGAEWMWAGLVGRSNALFDAGALTLRSSMLPASPGGSAARERAALQFEAEIQLLANNAELSSLEGRGELYGHILGACAGCHVLDDGGPKQAASPAVVPLASQMHDRYHLLETARASLRAGDIDGMKAAATSIATLPSPTGVPSKAAHPWRPWAAEVRLRAAELASMNARHQAAKGLTHLVLACGSCHAALGGGPQAPTAAAAGDTEGVLWATLLSGVELHRADERARNLERLWTAPAVK